MINDKSENNEYEAHNHIYGGDVVCGIYFSALRSIDSHLWLYVGSFDVLMTF